MRCIHALPDPRLRRLVRFYWQLDATGETPPQRMLPYYEAELIIQSDAPPRYRTAASSGDADPAWERRHLRGVMKGVFPAFLELDFMDPSRVFGIRFRPFGMHAFVRSPADELTRSFTDIEDIFGRAGRDLVERVDEAGDLSRVADVFDTFLLERLESEGPLDERVSAACSALVESRGMAQVEDVAGSVRLGVRQLQRLFNRRVGVSPSTLGGLIRLNHFVELAQTAPESTLTVLALDCGYYDQPHLSRSFKRIVGRTPSEYLDSLPVLQRNLVRQAG